MPNDDRGAILEDELIMIRNSGEIPEIALHNALYYLHQDPDGPGLNLLPEEIQRLQEAVLGRYRRIILRDLNPRLRDKSIYRGIERSMVNWKRLCRFADREQLSIEDFKAEIAMTLHDFLNREIMDVSSGKRATSVNCNLERLLAFGSAVGFDPRTLPPGWRRHLGLA